jgi:hypothetical protein
MVTGGGYILVIPPPGIANFGFNARCGSGHFNYVNHAKNLHVNGPVDTLEVVGNMATFSGHCGPSTAPCNFNVTVVDNGEPGFTDMFSIIVSGGKSDAQGGTLQGGNIQIHN